MTTKSEGSEILETNQEKGQMETEQVFLEAKEALKPTEHDRNRVDHSGPITSPPRW